MKTLLLACVIGAAASAAYAQEAPTSPAPSAGHEHAAQEARALVERRQRMIDDCVENHGYEDDCVREVDTELRAEAMQTGARVIRLRPPG